MIPPADVERARLRLDLIAADVVMKRKGRELAGLCPFHNEKTPSFYVSPDKGFFHCFGCGAHGDAIAYIMRTRRLDFVDAVREILGLPVQEAKEAAPGTPARSANPDQDKSQEIRDILAGCGSITDRTAAWMYLHLRGLSRVRQDVLLAHQALYCHEIRDTLPALVAPIAGPDGQTTAIQRIWVLPRVEYGAGASPKDNRAPLQVRKKTLGPMGARAVRLRPAGRVLGLAEGGETALAAMAVERGIPVWAVCGVARLTRVDIPPEVERLVIYGDNGAVGRPAAQQAADWWRRQGLDAEAVFPDPSVSDFNDLLLAMEAA